MKKCDEGQVVLRMVQLAKEKNVEYIPSAASAEMMRAYCDRKGIPIPTGCGVEPSPYYAPRPDTTVINV